MHPQVGRAGRVGSSPEKKGRSIEAGRIKEGKAESDGRKAGHRQTLPCPTLDGIVPLSNCSCVCSVWSSLSHLPKLKFYPSQPGQPRCPRSPSHSSSWKGHSLLQTNPRTQNLDLPRGADHFLPVLWCGPCLPSPLPRQILCLTVPRDPTRTQHRVDAQAILACM